MCLICQIDSCRIAVGIGCVVLSEGGSGGCAGLLVGGLGEEEVAGEVDGVGDR